MTDPALAIPAPASSARPFRSIRWGLIFAWTVTGFALLLALFAWLPWVDPRAAAMTPFGRLQQPAVTADPRLAALADKVDALVANPASLTINAETEQRLQERIASTIRTDSIEAATKAAVETSTRVAGETAGTAARGAALAAVVPLLDAARLDDKLGRGTAYQAELTRLAPQLTDSETADLAPLAGGGTDNAALVAQLDARQRGLLAAYRESQATGWWDKIRARISALVTITRPGDMPDAAAATLARLRAQIAQDDAAGAGATLRMLPQPLQDDLQPLDAALAAKARAKAAVDSLQARLAAAVPHSDTAP